MRQAYAQFRQSFEYATIGGFASLPGCIVGGIILGIIQNMVGLFISARAISVAPFLVIMLILLLRPQGLFGGAVVTTTGCAAFYADAGTTASAAAAKAAPVKLNSIRRNAVMSPPYPLMGESPSLRPARACVRGPPLAQRSRKSEGLAVYRASTKTNSVSAPASIRTSSSPVMAMPSRAAAATPFTVTAADGTR